MKKVVEINASKVYKRKTDKEIMEQLIQMRLDNIDDPNYKTGEPVTVERMAGRQEAYNYMLECLKEISNGLYRNHPNIFKD